MWTSDFGFRPLGRVGQIGVALLRELIGIVVADRQKFFQSWLVKQRKRPRDGIADGGSGYLRREARSFVVRDGAAVGLTFQRGARTGITVDASDDGPVQLVVLDEGPLRYGGVGAGALVGALRGYQAVPFVVNQISPAAAGGFLPFCRPRAS